ncbi:NAD-dependent protein deacylase [Paenibacillus sp. GCM10027626]|uniref:NAD-dependent protein deacylase n=1 Tax=Paenibacillus sp. GCM10027626 TaxID=3273411 RepID=UPI0036329F98
MEEVQKVIVESSNIVFFGGAGTSTESGIPDFRSADGLYHAGSGQQYAPEQILSRDFFMSHMAAFYTFYKTKMLYPEAKPNRAHLALAELERRGQLRGIVTQNIDGLHQLAGSRNVLELHGSVLRNYCMSCKAEYPLETIMASADDIPRCEKCQGFIKPDVVLYQESLDMEVLEQAASLITQADVLIVAGTSLTVQPAAGLVRLYEGNRLIIINRDPTPMDHLANARLGGNIGDVLHELVN